MDSASRQTSCCSSRRHAWSEAAARSAGERRFNSARIRARSWAFASGTVLFTRFPGLGEQGTPFVHPLLDFLFHALIGWRVVMLVGAQVILRGEMIRMVVRVLVTFAVAEAFGALVMRVAQVSRHGEGAAGADVVQR